MYNACVIGRKYGDSLGVLAREFKFYEKYKLEKQSVILLAALTGLLCHRL